MIYIYILVYIAFESRSSAHLERTSYTVRRATPQFQKGNC